MPEIESKRSEPGEKHHELPPVLFEAFACLRPINRLPKQAVENIAAQACLYQASVGESLLQRISDEKYVHYLLDGSVQIFGANSKTETLIASDPTAKNALGRITKSAQDIVANCPSSLVQLPWEALEKFLIQYAPAELSSTLEVQEILSATSSDWMVRLLQSDLFSMLPAGNIQKVLASIEFLETVADEIVITEGAQGDHFYIVDQGDYLVTKRNSKTGAEVELTHLTSDDFFGEEALITGAARNATVTSLGNGRLIKINNETFKTCIVAPVVPLLSADQAEALVGKGAAYLDIRNPADTALSNIPNSAQLTSGLIRSERNKLDKQKTYVVIDESPATAAHAAFVLRARGYDAHCLNLPLQKYAVLQGFPLGENVQHESERSSEQSDTLEQIELLSAQHANLPEQAADANEFAHTLTGVGLAELIEELNDTYDSKDAGKNSDCAKPTTKAMSNLPQPESNPTSSLSESENTAISPPAFANAYPRDTQLANALAQQHASLTAEYQEKLRLQQIAARKAVEAYKVRLENEYLEKRTGLLENGKKLIALANKVSQQKAEIERMRKEVSAESTTSAARDVVGETNPRKPSLQLATGR